jgi:hypothetical protein
MATPAKVPSTESLEDAHERDPHYDYDHSTAHGISHLQRIRTMSYGNIVRYLISTSFKPFFFVFNSESFYLKKQ